MKMQTIEYQRRFNHNQIDMHLGRKLRMNRKNSGSKNHKDIIVRSSLYFMLFLYVLSASSDVSAASCGNVKLTQITKETVCDGSPFTIRLSDQSNTGNTNYWSGFQEAVFDGSRGINFNTFPDIDLTRIDDDHVDLSILCKDVSEGYVNVKLIGNNKTCALKLELESIYAPIKNSTGATIVTDIGTVRKLRDDEKNILLRLSAFVQISLMIIALIIIGVLLFVIVRLKRKHLSGHHKTYK